MPVLFGSYTVGTGFVDGSSHPFGLELWVKTTTAIATSIDVSTTYVDQDGNPPEVTTVTTSIPASTPTGTYIRVALNAGDYAVRDVTDVTVVDGTSGNAFELVSKADGYYGKPFGLAARIWDSFSPETLSGIEHTGDSYALEGNPWFAWTGDALSGREISGDDFPLTGGIYGNIIAGYLRLPSGVIISTGFRIIIKNSAGFALMGKCYPNGVYQITLDLQRYDRSYLLVGSSAIELYGQYGTMYIDGFVTQLGSKDMYFLPDQEAHSIGFKKKRLFA